MSYCSVVWVNYTQWRGQYAYHLYIDGLMQESRNFIANTLELHISYTNPSIYIYIYMLSFPMGQGLNGKKYTADLTHWGRVTHICVKKLTIIGSDNGLSPGRCQAIIWTNAGILLIGSTETNFSENLSKFFIFSFSKMHLKISSGKCRPFCLGLNVLTYRLMYRQGWQTLCMRKGIISLLIFSVAK